MHQQLISQLLSLGLSYKEAKLYLTLLEIGPNPVSAAARKAGITRTTSYAALESLKTKGLVSAIEQHGIQQYAPVHPGKLEEYAKQQKENAEQNWKTIKQILPQLKSLTGDLVLPPKVKFYEGLEGIKTIFKDSSDTLKDLPKPERIKYTFSSAPGIMGELLEFLDQYVVDREKLGIQVRVILPQSKHTEDYKRKVHVSTTMVRLLPRDIHFQFESNISIYGDKVAIMSLREERYHGVIIDSHEIATTQKAIFELAWRSCRETSGL